MSGKRSSWQVWQKSQSEEGAGSRVPRWTPTHTPPSPSLACSCEKKGDTRGPPWRPPATSLCPTHRSSWHHSPGDTEVSLDVQVGVRWAGTAFDTLIPAEVTTAISPTGLRAGQVLAGLSTRGHTRAVLLGGLTGQRCSERGHHALSSSLQQCRWDCHPNEN